MRPTLSASVRQPHALRRGLGSIVAYAFTRAQTPSEVVLLKTGSKQEPRQIRPQLNCPESIVTISSLKAHGSSQPQWV